MFEPLSPDDRFCVDVFFVLICYDRCRKVLPQKDHATVVFNLTFQYRPQILLTCDSGMIMTDNWGPTRHELKCNDEKIVI